MAQCVRTRSQSRKVVVANADDWKRLSARLLVPNVTVTSTALTTTATNSSNDQLNLHRLIRAPYEL